MNSNNITNISTNNSTDIMSCDTSININELYQTQRIKQCNRLLYFENILKKCHHRIKTVAKKTETFCSRSTGCTVWPGQSLWTEPDGPLTCDDAVCD